MHLSLVFSLYLFCSAKLFLLSSLFSLLLSLLICSLYCSCHFSKHCWAFHCIVQLIAQFIAQVLLNSFLSLLLSSLPSTYEMFLKYAFQILFDIGSNAILTFKSLQFCYQTSIMKLFSTFLLCECLMDDLEKSASEWLSKKL